MTGPLYTWRDAERALSGVPNPPWLSFRVDLGEATIVSEPEKARCSLEALRELFGSRFTDRKLRLEGMPGQERFLEVHVEESPSATDEATRRIVRPLWGDALVADPDPPDASSRVRVAAFYSYKGGVGRTTCLLGTAASLLQRPVPASILVVDADLEAPGLTWNLKGSQDRLSLLDALGLIHDEDDWRGRALPLITAQLQRHRETLELSTGQASFYFLPAFRDFEQIFSLPLSFEQLVRSRGRAHVVGDALIAIGESLGVQAVLVDLRAGITEFSSPLLLDGRVQAVLVTSCNEQSVEGTVKTLQRMRKRTREATSPEVVISMIPPGEPDSLITGITERLLTAIPSSSDEPWTLDRVVHRVNFAQELLHYASVEDLLGRKIPGTDLGKTTAPELADLLVPEGVSRAGEAPSRAFKSMQRVIEEARRLEYAESSGTSDLLPTAPLTALVEESFTSLPAAVVLGSKGAGKTFAWMQMIAAGTWRSFCRKLRPENFSAPDGEVFPLLAPINLEEQNAKLVNEAEARIWQRTARGEDREVLRSALEEFADSQGSSVSISFWTSWIARRLGLPEAAGRSVEELAGELRQRSCPLVLAIDGFEDAFQVSPSEPLNRGKSRVLRDLLQRFVPQVRDLASPFLGIIVFVRRDLAEESIPQNFGQFESLYSRFSLVWSPTEALRLAAWLLDRAEYQVLEREKIPTASYDEIKQALQYFWGLRMGSERSKEAYTDRWVIAALSDLQGRIQPRDIVRLIRFAAQQDPGEEMLTPQALRGALAQCSVKKIEELEQEVRALKPLFDRFRQASPEKKVIPFLSDDFDLKDEEVAFLKRQGVATSLEEDRALFMPEIIRQGLRFKLKEGGGRAKVLTLYRQAQLKNL